MLDLQVVDTAPMIRRMLGLWRIIISTFRSCPIAILSIRYCVVKFWNDVWARLWSGMNGRYRTVSSTKLLLIWEYLLIIRHMSPLIVRVNLVACDFCCLAFLLSMGQEVDPRRILSVTETNVCFNVVEICDR